MSSADVTFTVGQRLLATVVATGLNGGTLLSMQGREVMAGGALPHPPGTRVRLEVVAGGAQPVVRLVTADVDATPDAETHDAVSPDRYALAAAVLAAREAPDVAKAMAAVATQVPHLVARRVLGAADADALLALLLPLRGASHVSGSPAAATAEGLARALAARLAQGGVMLERHVADVLRQATDGTAVAADLRFRLAALLARLPAGPGDVRDAVSHLQGALLAEQARVAAHLVREGIVDVRIPMQVDPHETDLRLRVSRDPEPDHDDEGSTPWRHARFDMTLPELGRVHVRLRLGADGMRTEFLVEEPSAADRIEAHLDDLTMSLERVGFARVLTRVVVDPVAVSAPDELPDVPPGTIVDVHA
ncbi:MAG: flagellar hook-length control protein FliK [Acidobacteria bacterium]|nr:flagellar hook-length control protein FliK [Acidobacteriota bacterium]